MTTFTLSITVKPRSHVSELTQAEDGTWLARLKSPPVGGKANAELVALVAGRFGVRKADVTIAAGASSRIKRVRVERRKRGPGWLGTTGGPRPDREATPC